MFHAINDEQTPECKYCKKLMVETPMFGWVCRNPDCRKKYFLNMARQERGLRQEERDYDLGDWSRDDD